jgi:hypothetical protein
VTDKLAVFRLNAPERDSTSWDKTTKYVEQRLTAYRAIVENPTKTEAERLSAAHRIDELKQLLRLAKPAPEKLGIEADQ